MTEDYHKYTEYIRYVDFKRLDFIVRTLKENLNKNDTRGLDLGCNKGNITVPLAYLGYNMIGIDISHENIKAAKSKQVAKNNPTFLVGDVEKLQLDKGVFDFAVCSEILEHLNHPEYTLNSIYEGLKEEALLVVTVPNGYGLYSLIFDHFRNKIFSKIFPSVGLSEHVQEFTLSKISNLIKKSGFEVLEVNHSDFISFLPIIARSDKFCYLDCYLADKFPHQLVSGFYFTCKKIDHADK